MSSRRIRFRSGHAPERALVLYDGECRFCRAQMNNLLRLARPNALEPLSFQDEGVLERFEGITWEECMEAMHLITPDGRVYRGMEAAARAVTTRRILGAFAWLYYVPLLRQLLDAFYRWIAKRRYAIAGRELRADCESACAAHFPDSR